MDPERRHYFDLLQHALEEIPGAAPVGDGRGIVTCGSARFAPLLQHFMQKVTSPPTVRQAVAKRIRSGLAWVSKRATSS